MKTAPRKELSLFDSSCIIVGIIIGVGIYQMAPDIAKGAGSGWGVMALWAVGGLLSLCGALGYAELASAYPRAGGDFVYLSRAYGKWAGFLFGWIQLVVVRPGDIAVIAFAFATYACTLYDPFAGAEGPYGKLLYASGATALLTAINILNVRFGKWTQNLLVVVKVLGLLAIVGVALASPRSAPAAAEIGSLPLSLALIFVLFTFGGWNEMAYVAQEVKNPARNIVRALVLGTVSVTVLYLLVNAAFLYTLGFSGLAGSKAIGVDAIANVFPVLGGALIAVLICISALGALNGLIFTGARISYAVGAEHRLFRLLGQWSGRTATPVWALLVQGLIAVTLILILQSFMDAVIYTAAAVYSFYLATSLAVVVLRIKEPDTPRPYRVTAYPLPILIFVAVCGFLIYSAVTYKPWVAAGSAAILLCGFPVYLIARKMDSKEQNSE